jgi:hypothetical protein
MISELKIIIFWDEKACSLLGISVELAASILRVEAQKTSQSIPLKPQISDKNISLICDQTNAEPEMNPVYTEEVLRSLIRAIVKLKVSDNEFSC